MRIIGTNVVVVTNISNTKSTIRRRYFFNIHRRSLLGILLTVFVNFNNDNNVNMSLDIFIVTIAAAVLFGSCICCCQPFDNDCHYYQPFFHNQKRIHTLHEKLRRLEVATYQLENEINLTQRHTVAWNNYYS